MSTTCPHASKVNLALPTPHTPIYKDECTQCFDSASDALGIDVCLTCYNGGCVTDFNHAAKHAEKTGHHLALNVKRREKVIPGKKEEKITKVAIGVPGGASTDQIEYEWSSSLKCYGCGGVEVARNITDMASLVSDAVLAADSAGKVAATQSWEAQKKACAHVGSGLKTVSSPKKLSSKSLSKCESCSLNSNLWLCLVCGALGCGRSNFDGSGGNGHALSHADSSGHRQVCKMGTITPEGKGDVFCYQCDDDVIDPLLGQHLASFGIDLSKSVKTDVSMAEMELSLNLNRDWDSVTEAGEKLKNVYGPGLTGLENLGNSCYMASVLQCLLSLPWGSKWSLASHGPSCTSRPHARCLRCQLSKLSHGLGSGKYSKGPKPSSSTLDGSPPSKSVKNYVNPSMFKSLIGRDHPEFKTTGQQDVLEFLSHLLQVVDRDSKSRGYSNPNVDFTFELEQRLQCTKCKGVRYSNTTTSYVEVPLNVPNPTSTSPIPFGSCLTALSAPVLIPGWVCPVCGPSSATTTTKFASTPDYLLLVLRRFQALDWVPVKLSTPTPVPTSPIDWSPYIGFGKKPSETALPESSGSQDPPVDPGSLAQLTSMGFPPVRCEKALRATGGDVGAATNWIMEHMDDPDIDKPSVNTAPSSKPVSQESIGLITSMGFTPEQASKALASTDGNPERAIEWLFSHPEEPGSGSGSGSGSAGHKGSASFQLVSFITHRGKSVHSGHYVAHQKVGDKWVLFNDRHVAELLPETPPPTELAYLYVFKRIPN